MHLHKYISPLLTQLPRDLYFNLDFNYLCPQHTQESTPYAPKIHTFMHIFTYITFFL